MFAFDYIGSLIAVDPGAITIHERFIAGGIAGAIAQTIIYPLDIIKTRLIISTPGMYTGAMSCFRDIIRQKGGIRSLYKGLSMCVLGVFPYSGLDLMTNSLLRGMASSYYERRNQEPGIISLLLCGTISSSVAMTATYPIGLLRTRLQASGMPESISYASPSQAVIQIFKSEGIRGFFKVSFE
jgi:solute carrier family 25 phosphate transporter 23/24/25/41